MIFAFFRMVCVSVRACVRQGMGWVMGCLVMCVFRFFRVSMCCVFLALRLLFSLGYVLLKRGGGCWCASRVSSEHPREGAMAQWSWSGGNDSINVAAAAASLLLFALVGPAPHLRAQTPRVCRLAVHALSGFGGRGSAPVRSVGQGWRGSPILSTIRHASNCCQFRAKRAQLVDKILCGATPSTRTIRDRVAAQGDSHRSEPLPFFSAQPACHCTSFLREAMSTPLSFGTFRASSRPPTWSRSRLSPPIATIM